MHQITVYTDGACSGNPGPGGYGVVMLSGTHRKELSQAYKHTTNNRMELLAVIVALEAIKVAQAEVIIYSDSKYVVDSITKGWVYSWLKKRFKGKKNKDLWLRYLAASRQYQITMCWVKGHAGNPENERCDVLATSAHTHTEALEDEGFFSD